MKLALMTFAGAALLAAGTANAALDNAAAEAMMKKDGCAACHRDSGTGAAGRECARTG